MNWDHRDAYDRLIGDASEGQQAEGGVNRDSNCVPTSETIICQAYGGPDIAPQDITDRAYGRTFHGGEDYPATVAVLRQLWPQCPTVTYASRSDVLAAIDAEASQRHAVACSFHCDGAGTIQTHVTGILHVCVLLAHVGGQVFVLNVERDSVATFGEADFAAATSGAAGELMIFQQPLPTPSTEDEGMTLPVAQSIVFAILTTAFGHGPQSQAQVDAYAVPMSQPGANPEAKLTDLVNDLAKDPSTLANRLSRLEAKS